MNDLSIVGIEAREILDSRANPTVECTVTLQSGVRASASVPSGASVGRHEACELRDRDGTRFCGRGVRCAVENVNRRIAAALLGVCATDQVRADSLMIALDGAYNKSNLGANAILCVSIAVAKAAAAGIGIPFYRYLGGAFAQRLPIPMMNILNGGAHASNNVDIQEFMIVPAGAPSFSEAVRAGAEIYHALRDELRSQGKSVSVGDEGGFSPDLSEDEEAIGMLMQAICRAGYTPGEDVFIALDAAASEWAQGGMYVLPKRQEHKSAQQLIAHYALLCEKYPVLSIEDGLGEQDTAGWQSMTKRIGKQTLLVGDDLFATNPTRLAEGIREGIANAVLIKPNQIGTLTETAQTVALAKAHGYRVIFSHRSGETADSAIADLAFAMGADYFKSGAPARAERTEKYNRMMKIESELFGAEYGDFHFRVG